MLDAGRLDTPAAGIVRRANSLAPDHHSPTDQGPRTAAHGSAERRGDGPLTTSAVEPDPTGGVVGVAVAPFTRR